MKKVFKYLLRVLVFLIPAWLLIVVYLITDPFKVIHTNSPFYAEEGYLGVNSNAGYISTMTFKENYPRYHYDSFIFGSSRSIHYSVSDWKKYIGDSASCYHFNADGETLYGMMKKVEYIDSVGAKIENALFIVDSYLLECDYNKPGHLYTICPELEGGRNQVMFHWQFFKAFTSPEFWYTFADFKINGELKPYMLNQLIISHEYIHYDVVTNEVRDIRFEQEIADGQYFNSRRLENFLNLRRRPFKRVMGTRHKVMLERIASILERHSASYKVIVHPIYNRVNIDSEDLKTLKAVFGKENVYDFSSDSVLTSDYTLFYDPHHLRPKGTRQILERVYLPNDDL